MLSLRIQEAAPFFVLGLIEDALEQLFKVVLPHYSMRHHQESFLGVGANLLARILQVVGQLRNQLVGVFKEENIVAHGCNELA